jgi:lipoate-protein ligase B
MRATLDVVDLGTRGYGPTLDLQRDLIRRRLTGEIPRDLLLLVQHPPVITLGRGTRPTSLPLSREQLEQRGLEVHEVERGGDVTHHGPGQLVGYPLLDLQQLTPDLHWYLRELEGALIDTLADLGIAAGRNPGLTGVWTGGRKIASIGIHVKQWITMHGFALNVANDLSWFDYIVPCGIRGVEMTSVSRELGTPAAPAALLDRTRRAVIRALGTRFDREPAETTIEALLAPAAGK